MKLDELQTLCLSFSDESLARYTTYISKMLSIILNILFHLFNSEFLIFCVLAHVCSGVLDEGVDAATTLLATTLLEHWLSKADVAPVDN